MLPMLSGVHELKPVKHDRIGVIHTVRKLNPARRPATHHTRWS
jgi:hypothetical protein